MARIDVHNLGLTTIVVGGTQHLPPGGYCTTDFITTLSITGDSWALVRNVGMEPILIGGVYCPVGAGNEFDVDDELVVATSATDAVPAPPVPAVETEVLEPSAELVPATEGAPALQLASDAA